MFLVWVDEVVLVEGFKGVLVFSTVFMVLETMVGLVSLVIRILRGEETWSFIVFSWSCRIFI